MKPSEINLLQSKLQEQQVIIKDEHRKPKKMRNQKVLQVALVKSKTYKRWIDE